MSIDEKLGKILATQEHQSEQLRAVAEDIKRLTYDFQAQRETLDRNTQIVDEHQRRSTALEKEIRRIEDGLSEVQDHVTRVEGVGKFIRWCGYLAAAGTSIFGFLKLMGMK